MRRFLYHFVMLSVLFMSLDGAADITITGHPHGDDPAHQIDTLKSSSAETPADSDLNLDHCDHCCHGHGANIITQVTSITSVSNAGDQLDGCSRLVDNLAQAPPTPPPTT